MGKKSKRVVSHNQRVKTTSQQRDPTNDLHPIWNFTNVDTEGMFAFDLTRKDLDSKFLLNKLVDYSSMTWQEILQQTHDGKSKHHKLDNLDRLSKEAQIRIEKKHLNLDTDAIFSFALDNMKRLIGIRNGAVFQVIWYDANHEFAPSAKKHT